MNSIDLAQKNPICNVIALFYLHCDVIRHLLVQAWFVYLCLSVQTLSTNFGGNAQLN